MAVQAELLSISSGLDDLVSLGKAVGDRLRASILQVLHQDSYAVGELCTLFDVPQPPAVGAGHEAHAADVDPLSTGFGPTALGYFVQVIRISP